MVLVGLEYINARAVIPNCALRVVTYFVRVASVEVHIAQTYCPPFAAVAVPDLVATQNDLIHKVLVRPVRYATGGKHPLVRGLDFHRLFHQQVGQGVPSLARLGELGGHKIYLMSFLGVVQCSS